MPARAIATARLAIVVDLPSCSTALVTMITFASLPSDANSTFVRQHAERFRLDSTRVREHDEPVLSAQLLQRFGQAGEERQAEPLANRLCRTNAGVERFAQEGEADA